MHPNMDLLIDSNIRYVLTPILVATCAIVSPHLKLAHSMSMYVPVTSWAL